MGGPCDCDGRSWKEMDNFLICKIIMKVLKSPANAKARAASSSAAAAKATAAAASSTDELVDVEFQSAEQYFQYMKWELTGAQRAKLSPEQLRAKDAHQATILKRDTDQGHRCWALGNRRLLGFRSDWERVKVDIMYAVNLAKFQQNPKLREALLSTKGKIVAHGFAFWAVYNGVLLERIREEIRPAGARNKAKLAALVKKMNDYRKS